jgi:predicted short-subunit dehydrogenase-like oxidoreductase (DUF2520 family)
MKVGIVGNGNLAYHLAKRLFETKNPLTVLCVRSAEKADEFRPFFGNESQVATQTDLSSQNLDLIILAVSDGAIEDVISCYQFPAKATVVHNSGAQGINVFERSTIEFFGVIYPLQTFTKEKKINFNDTPIFIESNNETAFRNIETLADRLSNKVSILRSKERRKVHLAAVMACNFSNALYILAENQLNAMGLDFDLIKPLISETTQKALTLGPSKSQTGPASRGDESTIGKHKKLLKKDPETLKIYKQLTRLIQKQSQQ